MTAALVAAVAMGWAWVLRARNLDRRDRAMEMESGEHERISS